MRFGVTLKMQIRPEHEWDNKDLENQRDIDIPLFQERMNICKSCEHLQFNFCMKCGCLMPFKTRLKSSSCPIGKWTYINK